MKVSWKRIRQGLLTLVCILAVVSVTAVCFIQLICIPRSREGTISVFWNGPFAYKQDLPQIHFRSAWRKIMFKNGTVFWIYTEKSPNPGVWGRCPCCEE